MFDNEINQQILSNLNTAILLLSSDLKITYVNQAAELLFEQSSHKLIGKPINEVCAYSDFDFKKLTTYGSNATSYTNYETLLVIERQPTLVDITASEISISNDSSHAFILEIKKISKERTMEREHQQRNQQEAARNLVRGLAHEIKNPLGGIRGAAQLIEKEYRDNDEIQEYCKIIIEQSDRLKHLVDRLLGPQKAIPASENNIHLVLEKVRKLIELETNDSITITRDYDPSLPNIKMDEEKLEQAFLNIIGNAVAVIKESNTPQGLISIKTRADYNISILGKTFPTVLKIEITDNGPGIPPEIADTIFYPMVTHRLGGSGLGLPIAQTIISQHHGKIECQSFSGETKFITYIPISTHDK